MNKKAISLIIACAFILTGCDYSNSQNKTGFFYNTFAKPMDDLLHWLGTNFNHNYGLAIIVIVLIVRIAMAPFMLSQSKNGQLMRKKMEVIKPDLDKVQEKVKRARTQEDKMKANQEMMEKYKEYDMNPLKSMLGCLPLLVQMPILFGLYVSLKWPSNGGINEFPEFLWFNLTKPDIWITIIAGLLYVVQSLVSLSSMPKEQKSMGYMMVIISPIFIVYISITSASALGLYWSINALFLIIQMYLANKYYSKYADIEAEKLRMKIQNKNPEKTRKNSTTIKKKNKK